ncbi:MAG: IclR family transcriptional regulator [Proteobacteria bacterium]|nr:IclR family transcriptional regulator [Pseudomonadota bacterium]
MNDYSAPIIKKAIDIIVLIGKENRPLGVSEISKTLIYSKSTTYGVLKALSEVGFLYKDSETKKYSIGKKLLRLSKIIYKNQDILFIIRPFLENLAELIDETVFFGVNENDALKILSVVEAKKSLKLSAPVGTKMPLTAGAAGKVFFSALKNDEIISILNEKGLPKYTENTITDLDDFIREIEKTRELGYGVDLEEYLKGVRAVASLIYQDNHPLGAIWVVGFSNSIIDEKLQFIIKQLKITAERINKRISFSTHMDEGRKAKES